MAKKRTSDTRTSGTQVFSPDAIERRTALKQLGAIALYGPVLASIACDGDPETKDMNSSPAATGSDSGSTPTATPDAGSSPGTGATGTDAGAAPSHSDSGATGASKDSGPATSLDAASSGAQDAASDSAMGQALGDAGAATGGFFPPMFADAPMCTLTGTDTAGEGPFFIHEDEVMADPSLKRVDIRDGHEGVELQLNYRLLDADGNCMKGIADVEVYTWHTDALGMYSGFNNQNPNMTYSGAFERTVENMERFCRGMQVTNADGVASFRSVYPGWYFGRPIHIHFVALKKGSLAATSSYRTPMFHIFTTQLYFEEQFSRKIHENNAPYTTRTSGNGYTMYVKPNAQSMVRPAVRMEGNVVVASINVITKSSASRR